MRAGRAMTFAQVCAGAGRMAELRKFNEEAERAFAADLTTIVGMIIGGITLRLCRKPSDKTA